MCFFGFTRSFLLSELVMCVFAIYPPWGEWRTQSKIDSFIYPSQKMPVQRSSSEIACLEEDAQQETTATAHERAWASNPPAEQGRGATRIAGVPQDLDGQVDEGKDEEGVDKEDPDANSSMRINTQDIEIPLERN